MTPSEVGASEVHTAAVSPRVLVLEDDGFTLSTVAAALRQGGMDVVAECATVAEAVRAVARETPDVAVVDLDLGPGPTGLDAAMAMRRYHPGLGIVVLTSYRDPRLMRSNLPAMPDGAQYVVKSDVHQINQVIDAISRAASPDALADPRPVEASTFPHLTDSQIETLRLVAQGMTNAEIARTRFVTEKTVEQMIARIVRALNLVTEPNQNQRVAIARAYFRLVGRDVS